MRESKVIIIVSLFGQIFLIVLFFCLKSFFDFDLLVNIITNLSCGLIVAFVTAFCNYFVQKRKILRNLFNAYYDIYNTYNLLLNNSKHHINSKQFYEIIVKNNTIISDLCDEYCGLFSKKYNPKVLINKELNVNNFVLCLIIPFNKNTFSNTFGSLMETIQQILIDIDETKFYNRKKEFNKIYKSLGMKTNEGE